MAKRDASTTADVEHTQPPACQAFELVQQIAAAAVNIEVARREEIGQTKSTLEGVVQLSDH